MTLKEILLPTDFSENSRAALRYAAEIAKKFSANLTLLHVIPGEEIEAGYIQKRSPEKIAEIRKEAGREFEQFIPPEISSAIPINRAIEVGEPVVEIVRYAHHNGTDLIVMATHGRPRISHALMGSVAEKVVRKAPCPVLTVKHSDFQFEMVL